MVYECGHSEVQAHHSTLNTGESLAFFLCSLLTEQRFAVAPLLPQFTVMSANPADHFNGML